MNLDEQLIALGGLRSVSEWVCARPISTAEAYAILRELEVNAHDITADNVRVASARLRYQAEGFDKAAKALLTDNTLGLAADSEIMRNAASLVDDTTELAFMVRDARIVEAMTRENHEIVGALKDAAHRCRTTADQLDQDRWRIFGRRYQARISNLQRTRSAA